VPQRLWSVCSSGVLRRGFMLLNTKVLNDPPRWKELAYEAYACHDSVSVVGPSLRRWKDQKRGSDRDRYRKSNDSG